MEPTEITNASVIVLKSGTQLICDLKELYDGEGENKKGICLLLIHPYELSLVSSPEVADSQQELQVKFSKWCPYSTDFQFKVPYDSVMAIGTPDSGLEQVYRAKVEMLNQMIQQNSEPTPETVTPEVMPNE